MLILHLCCLPRLADAYFYTSADCQTWLMFTSSPLLTAKHCWCLLPHLCWLPRLAYTYFYTSADCLDWQMPCLLLKTSLHSYISTGAWAMPNCPPMHLCFISGHCSRKCFLLHLHWPLFMSIAWECLFLQLRWISAKADAYLYLLY
jgi:hypothetical protein